MMLNIKAPRDYVLTLFIFMHIIGNICICMCLNNFIYILHAYIIFLYIYY